MQLRRGREFYGSKFEKALELHAAGKSVSEIAKTLGISYSAAYHWIKGLRKPEAGNTNEFIAFLRQQGPSAALHVMEKFPKHNEIFHLAAKRGLLVKRLYLGREFKELGTWYFLPGQEQELEKRVAEMKGKVAKLKGKMREIFGKY